eukprot:TRINITY_DN14727_c0_g1_i1.p1 TRINITY_DN14727_c0_g1~~TRINITY_DN14727_c0_g1_i1.p1  ORF type:complete len:292 (-),score=52.90 TRINITY_DN14727_c0_g1_i1:349-1224(-)
MLRSLVGSEMCIRDSLGCVIRWMSLLTAIFLLITGIAHAILSFNSWCDDSVCGSQPHGTDCSCVGPWLVWTKKEGLDFFKAPNNGATYIQSNNYNGVFGSSTETYGTAFTLNIQTLFKNWVPLFVGLFSFMEHLEPFARFKLLSMWNSFVFWLVAFFFIAFPCAGNFGVVTGFFCVITSFLCLLGVFLSKGEPATFGKYRAGIYEKCKCGQNKWQRERNYFVKHKHHIHQDVTSVKVVDPHKVKGGTVVVRREGHHGDVVVTDSHGHVKSPKSPRSPRSSKGDKTPRQSHH